MVALINCPTSWTLYIRNVNEYIVSTILDKCTNTLFVQPSLHFSKL